MNMCAQLALSCYSRRRRVNINLTGNNVSQVQISSYICNPTVNVLSMFLFCLFFCFNTYFLNTFFAKDNFCFN